MGERRWIDRLMMVPFYIFFFFTREKGVFDVNYHCIIERSLSSSWFFPSLGLGEWKQFIMFCIEVCSSTRYFLLFVPF